MAAVARVARPGCLRRRLAASRCCAQRFLLVYGLMRNEEGWGSALIVSCSRPPHCCSCCSWWRSAAPPTRCSTLAVPQAGLHGRHDRGFALSASIFSMFLYITLFSRTSGLLAVRGGAPVAAGDGDAAVRIAAERPADGARAGAAAARDGARVRDGRAAADGEPVRLVREDRAAARPDPGRHRDRPGASRWPRRRRRGGPAAERQGSGANNTARQLGSPPGSPASARSPVEDRVDADPAGGGYARVVARPRAFAGSGSGGTGRALQAVPPADRDRWWTRRTTRS